MPSSAAQCRCCRRRSAGQAGTGPAFRQQAVPALPSAGPLCYLLTFLRAVAALRATTAATGVHSSVPGLLELSDPSACRVTFVLPLEPRADLLPVTAAPPCGSGP